MHDDSPYDRAEEDMREGQAQDSKAWQDERDMIDTAMSEEIDPRQAEIDALKGLSLAWWKEEDLGMAQIDIVAELANKICGIADHYRLLEEYGLPEDVLTAELRITHTSGPIITVALQVLGTLHPHLREDIRDILQTLQETIPKPNEEQAAAYAAATEALAQARLDAFQDAVMSAGGQIMSREEFEEHEASRSGKLYTDPGLN